MYILALAKVDWQADAARVRSPGGPARQGDQQAFNVNIYKFASSQYPFALKPMDPEINRMCSPINWTKIDTSYWFSLLILKFYWSKCSCNMEAMGKWTCLNQPFWCSKWRREAGFKEHDKNRAALISQNHYWWKNIYNILHYPDIPG